jgi:hypothetical protein
MVDRDGKSRIAGGWGKGGLGSVHGTVWSHSLSLLRETEGGRGGNTERNGWRTLCLPGDSSRLDGLEDGTGRGNDAGVGHLSAVRTALNEIHDVRRHLFYLCVVESLNVSQVPHVSLGDEVNGDSLSAEPSRAADTVDVILSVRGEIVVDHEGHLLDIDASGEEISGDQHARGARSELPHDELSLFLVHISVHGRDCEVSALHLLREPVDLPASVAVDDRLCNRQSSV